MGNISTLSRLDRHTNVYASGKQEVRRRWAIIIITSKNNYLITCLPFSSSRRHHSYYSIIILQAVGVGVLDTI